MQAFNYQSFEYRFFSVPNNLSSGIQVKKIASVLILIVIAALSRCKNEAAEDAKEFYKAWASNSLTEGSGRFAADNIIDQSLSSWCGTGSQGLTIRLSFQERRNLSRLYVSNGLSVPEFYRRNNRIRKAKLVTDTKEELSIELKDTNEPQEIVIKPLREVERLTFEILDTYQGSSFNDTCITEISPRPLRLSKNMEYLRAFYLKPGDQFPKEELSGYGYSEAEMVASETSSLRVTKNDIEILVPFTEGSPNCHFGTVELKAAFDENQVLDKAVIVTKEYSYGENCPEERGASRLEKEKQYEIPSGVFAPVFEYSYLCNPPRYPAPFEDLCYSLQPTPFKAYFFRFQSTDHRPIPKDLTVLFERPFFNTLK